MVPISFTTCRWYSGNGAGNVYSQLAAYVWLLRAGLAGHSNYPCSSPEHNPYTHTLPILGALAGTIRPAKLLQLEKKPRQYKQGTCRGYQRMLVIQSKCIGSSGKLAKIILHMEYEWLLRQCRRRTNLAQAESHGDAETMPQKRSKVDRGGGGAKTARPLLYLPREIDGERRADATDVSRKTQLANLTRSTTDILVCSGQPGWSSSS